MLPMKADLQELMITDGEIKKIVEIPECVNLEHYFFMEYGLISSSNIPNLLTSLGAYSFVGWIIVLCIYGFIGFLFQFNLFQSDFYLIALIIVSILIGILLTIYVIGTSSKKGKTMRILWSEVKKHNLIINNLHTLDQLQAVGNPVKINDRVKVIQALKITKEGLVRAFKTEKILLSNPNFKPEYFNIDLTSLQAERTMAKAVEYAELLDQAVQIGVSVQTEMRKLQNNR